MFTSQTLPPQIREAVIRYEAAVEDMLEYLRQEQKTFSNYTPYSKIHKPSIVVKDK